MVDFSKLLTPEQKEQVRLRQLDLDRRTVGKITARDSAGNEFEKTAVLSSDCQMLDFGWPIQYNLQTLVNHVTNYGTDVCIDLGGRNHKGYPVYLPVGELRHLLDKAALQVQALKGTHT